MWRALCDAALAALLAPCCAVCDAVLERPLDGAVCAACWRRVRRFSAPFCRRCGWPLPSVRTAHDGCCQTCTVSLGAIAAARSVGAFDGAMADILHAFKYGPRPSLAGPLSQLMAQAGADLLAEVDLVVPVPLHRRRRRERGFNQAEALASGLGRPVCLALARPVATAPQVGLSGAARRANLRGAFVVTSAADRLRDRRVLVVDDVLTTGTTLAACAEALQAAGPRTIVALTAARAESGRRR